jgi:hypothetical protein
MSSFGKKATQRQNEEEVLRNIIGDPMGLSGRHYLFFFLYDRENSTSDLVPQSGCNRLGEFGELPRVSDKRKKSTHKGKHRGGNAEKRSPKIISDIAYLGKKKSSRYEVFTAVAKAKAAKTAKEKSKATKTTNDHDVQSDSNADDVESITEDAEDIETMVPINKKCNTKHLLFDHIKQPVGTKGCPGLRLHNDGFANLARFLEKMFRTDRRVKIPLHTVYRVKANRYQDVNTLYRADPCCHLGFKTRDTIGHCLIPTSENALDRFSHLSGWIQK